MTPSSRAILVCGETPMKEYRPTWIPRSTLSSRKEPPRPPSPAARSFRNADTGVSRSAPIRRRNGTRRPSPMSSTNSSIPGLIIIIAPKTKTPRSIPGTAGLPVNASSAYRILRLTQLRFPAYVATPPPATARLEHVTHIQFDVVHIRFRGPTKANRQDKFTLWRWRSQERSSALSAGLTMDKKVNNLKWSCARAVSRTFGVGGVARYGRTDLPGKKDCSTPFSPHCSNASSSVCKPTFTTHDVSIRAPVPWRAR